jgi:hypothetical protein
VALGLDEDAGEGARVRVELVGAQVLLVGARVVEDDDAAETTTRPETPAASLAKSKRFAAGAPTKRPESRSRLRPRSTPRWRVTRVIGGESLTPGAMTAAAWRLERWPAWGIVGCRAREVSGRRGGAGRGRVGACGARRTSRGACASISGRTWAGRRARRRLQ